MGLPSWAPTAARGGLKLVIAGCLALFNYVFWYWVTDAYYVQMAAIFNNWGLKYPRSGTPRCLRNACVTELPVSWSCLKTSLHEVWNPLQGAWESSLWTPMTPAWWRSCGCPSSRQPTPRWCCRQSLRAQVCWPLRMIWAGRRVHEGGVVSSTAAACPARRPLDIGACCCCRALQCPVPTLG